MRPRDCVWRIGCPESGRSRACDAPGVAAAAAAVGANLLVADPQAGSFFQLKQMITEFGRGGVRPCPAVFRERLA